MSVAAIRDHGQHGRILDAFGAFPVAISHQDTLPANDMSPSKDSEKHVDENNNNLAASPVSEHPLRDWSEDSGCSLKDDDDHSAHEDECRDRNHSGDHSDSIDVEISDEASTNQDEDHTLVICEENEDFKADENKIDIKRERVESESSCHHSESSTDNEGRRLSVEHAHIFQPSRPQKERTIVSLDGFSHYFAHNLHTMHRRDLFCDVTIKAHDSLLHGHKVVLAACSPYLYNVLEKKSQHLDRKDGSTVYSMHSFIDLGKSVSPIGLEQILDCMYTSRISLHHDTVHDVLEAAVFLNMQLVVDVCYKFIDSEQMKEGEKYKIVTKQEFQRCDKEVESPIDLTATTKRNRRTSDIADDKLESKSVLETTDLPHTISTTCKTTNAASDPEENTIHQRASPHHANETKLSHPKSMNWKKFKLITQNRSDHSPISDTSARESIDNKQTTASSPQSRDYNNTEDDDDVFIKKESSRPARLSTDSAKHDFGDRTIRSVPPHHTLTADLIRRHQRDLYQHVMSNSPYSFHPETMAAAMAMTTLTSPLRTPTTPHLATPKAERAPYGINPWQHILGQRFHQPPPESPLLRSPFSDVHTPTSKSQSDYLREQKERHQAFLNLAGSANRFIPGRFVSQHVPERKVSTEKPSGPAYSPLLLANLLQQSHNNTLNHTLKRTYSAASGENHNEMPVQHAPKRMSEEGQTPFFTESSNHFLVNTIKNEIASRQQKQRRSTNSTTRSPDRPYKCLVCAAEFNRPANLKTHMRIHSGEKPYKCQSCGARFVQVAHLRAHILIHTGEKPYPCKVCGTRFRHLQTLKSHLRIHTGEKPYECEECQVRFRHKSQLRLHLRTKHGINTNTKKTYQQVPGLRSADISAHIKRTQEAVRMQAHKKDFCEV